ncbi:hypothetical protein PR048_014380 [Dryococelus australis]|uniref:Uncharacterized protein n=1 Tax=Dryococelus australis TaxID=614101 RepID=A0ABQ9HE43_9NEOP|nr:hypothetical protein PR048_014380 [Dryococelus australis]
MDGLISGQVDTRLSGEADWATWKFKFTVLLRKTNLLGITDGTTPPPVKEESKQDYEKWAEKDAKAQQHGDHKNHLVFQGSISISYRGLGVHASGAEDELTSWLLVEEQ